jgi:hypothetical protein
MWFSLLPLGVGAWAPIYAGDRAGRKSWIVLGAVWSTMIVAGFFLTWARHTEAIVVALVLVGWIGAIATSFAIRGEYVRALESVRVRQSGMRPALSDAEERLGRRQQAMRIAREEPQLALELGIGRPDLPGASHEGLVDVNNAPAETIAALPGLGPTLAERVVRAREELRGFSSGNELGLALDLDPALVEELAERTVYLPWRSRA